MSETPYSNVVYTEADSPARVLHFGEDFLEEHLPIGTRVILPKPPMKGLANVQAAIRYAINHPEGCDPLFSMLKPGMKVTIAVDDISLPLPKMVRPDVRQTMLEIVLEQLADFGVDDIHIIVATAFHRRMTPAEIRRMVGDTIYAAYAPDRLYNHDGEDPEGMTYLGTTEQGEIVELNRRAVESDLVIYLNINLVPMDGGNKSVTVGLSGYKSLKAHHNPKAILESDSYMDPANSALHDSIDRQGAITQANMKIFTIETVLNNRMYGPELNFLSKPEELWNSFDRMRFEAVRWTLSRTPRPLKRRIMHATPAPYEVVAVYAGSTDHVHQKTVARCFEQYVVPVEGQCDVLILGIPFLSPYNANSILNPLLVQVMVHGYLHNLYRGKPILRKGGTVIFTHPCYDAFHAGHHPSYIEFFNRLLPETRDSHVLQYKYEEEFATNPNYIQMYRHGYAFHGVHPFYMWYWGENGRAWAGRTIAAGAESPHVPERMGWEWSPDLQTAIEMARDTHGPSPEITYMRTPPIMMVGVS
ncbi:MAG: lactate racemase domain-containing protein [Myxococcota bacterium]